MSYREAKFMELLRVADSYWRKINKGKMKLKKEGYLQGNSEPNGKKLALC